MQAMTHVKREVFSSLKALAADQCSTVGIFGSSSKAKLEALFGDMDVWLAAENGVFMRPPSAAGQPTEVCAKKLSICLADSSQTFLMWEP